METSRREFMLHGIGAAAFLSASPRLLATSADKRIPSDTILVVVQLTGGNDGLNTVIPFRNDLYHEARPTLAISRNQVLKLDDELALHPQMTGMKRLFDEGLLAVVENVGYPDPDRSHFRSMDIWHTATLEPEGVRTGWLGRAMDESSADTPALHLDDGPLPMALAADRRTIPSISDIQAFRLQGDTDAIEAAIREKRPLATEDLLYVQNVAVSSLETAARIGKIASSGNVSGRFPPHAFGRRMEQIARLIAAEFGPRLYYTSIPGFDTHSKQALVHGPLLKTLSDGVAAFFDDLREKRIADRVLLMTFSEFGRRVMENGSQGTDHGAAAPLFIAGPRCVPGIHGNPPDLEDLDNGDVQPKTDFRRIYSAILKALSMNKPSSILGGEFDPIGVLRSC